MEKETDKSYRTMIEEMLAWPDFRNFTPEQKEAWKKMCQKRYDELVKQGIKPRQSDFYGS